MKDSSKIISIEDVKKARERIRSFINETQTEHSRSFSKAAGCEILLKKEFEQRTGSFKIRGACNKIQSLSEDERSRGVIACSAGNHAQGIAISAHQAGIPSKIVMPTNASLVKIQATKEYGADVILSGEFVDQALEHTLDLVKQYGYTFVHPFEDPLVIAGQGTIGLELLEQVKQLDCVVVPIGGGGLISGIATVVKSLNPKCKIVGVQAQNCSTMAESFKAGKIVLKSKPISSIADGIAVKKPSPIMYENYISKLVDDVYSVTEDEISEAIVFLMERGKMLVEGAGAVGAAVALSSRFKLKGNTCIVLSGGNIDMNLISKIVEQGLSRSGRVAHLSVVVADMPGALAKLTAFMADKRANILQVDHDRTSAGLHILETQIDFILEISGPNHLEEIKTGLLGLGVKLL